MGSSAARIRRAPGPPLSALPRLLCQLKRDRIRFFWDLWRRYGDVVRLDFPGRRVHLLCDADHVKYVLQTNWRNYGKAGAFKRERKVVVGDSLLTLDGADWLAQRRRVQPAFGSAQLDLLIPAIAEVADRSLSEWEVLARQGRAIDVADLLTKLTIEVAGQTLFGIDLLKESSTIREASAVVLEETSRRMAAIVPIPLWIPLPRHRRFRKMIDTLDEVVRRIIARRRGDSPGGKDVLSRLLEARDEETGLGLTDQELRNEVLTFLVAGNESTASNLAWTVWLVATHLEVEARLRAEIAEVLGDRLPEAADLPRLETTRMVIEESMRLYPPAWIFDRYALDDDEVGGYRIPAGSEIVILPWIQHRHPAYWDEPETFRPERFAEGEVARRPPFAYCPFGGGPRVCIGDRYSILESQVIIARLLQRYRLEVVPDHPIELSTLIALRPRHGVLARVRPAC